MSKLELELSAKREDINKWINASFANYVPPIFSSADIRQSGYKIAHVDSNLFPAGFNNILPDDIKFASIKFRQYIAKHFGNIESILVIPEDFTRNTRYFENIKALITIIQLAGYKAMFGSLVFEEKMVVSQIDIELHPITRTGRKIHVSNFYPDLILLNNDLVTGVPENLKGLEQQIIPNYNYGWHRRKKSNHFGIYNKIINDFSTEFDFDHWLMSAYFESAENVSFRQKIGLEDVASKVEAVLKATKAKYEEYDISEKPTVFVKADNGTYGMGIITASDPDEILNINKKHRHSLDVIKSGVHNSSVIIQECIPSTLRYQGHAAENMVYSLGDDIISNTIRYNLDKDEKSNLNTHGMHFVSKGRNVSYLQELVCKFMYIAAAKESVES